MTDPAVESLRQVQLTFQDKSTDSNLEAQVTREDWLNEVKTQIESNNSNIDWAAGSLSFLENATEESLSAETPLLLETANEPRLEPCTEEPRLDSTEESTLELTQTEAVNEALGLEPVAEPTVPSQIEFVVDVAPDALSASENLEILDFVNEPLPEPFEEASGKVTEQLGSLTLPAALCDEDLLQELASIPNKMGFKIGEVADMLGIKQYVLRYWETEFDVLKPKKAANNQRYYTKKDVENVYLIRKLLHRDRFSIEGARAALKDLKNVVKKEKDWVQVNSKVETMQERVDHLLVDLRKLRALFV